MTYSVQSGQKQKVNQVKVVVIVTRPSFIANRLDRSPSCWQSGVSPSSIASQLCRVILLIGTPRNLSAHINFIIVCDLHFITSCCCHCALIIIHILTIHLIVFYSLLKFMFYFISANIMQIPLPPHATLQLHATFNTHIHRQVQSCTNYFNTQCILACTSHFIQPLSYSYCCLNAGIC